MFICVLHFTHFYAFESQGIHVRNLGTQSFYYMQEYIVNYTLNLLTFHHVKERHWSTNQKKRMHHLEIHHGKNCYVLVRVGSKLAKLCHHPLFSMHGRNRGMSHATWHRHSWSESRDYISLYVYWVIAIWYSSINSFTIKNVHSFRLHGPFFII